MAESNSAIFYSFILNTNTTSEALIDSRVAAKRLLITLILMTFGSSAMYGVAVVIPAIQAEFGIDRADASIPYTLMMIGYGIGGIWMGRISDRWGVTRSLLIGAICLAAGYILAGLASNIWMFAIAHGFLIGLLGSSSTFAPLMADTSLWWKKYRGVAVAVCASGNYVAGAIWPGVMQAGIESMGWRQTYLWIGIFSGISMTLLALMMRQRPPLTQNETPTSTQIINTSRPFGLSMNLAQVLLCVAGVACCVAMSMPQVHIVAYCSDLGYGAARGAEMLSIMLTFGIVSRLVSGAICDRIGGLRTLILGSVLQGIALLLFVPFDGLVSLYVISALFGLFQGGIVPSYAIIVREYFPPKEAGARVGAVIMATMFGMALGGWLSGKVFDLTGSYDAAFLNGIAWNLLNLSIALFLWWKLKGSKLSSHS